ncbi:UNVERIFIED_CONTAM: hypothetical protein Sradi_0566700 [Sesamum radiatum]|uniref:Neurotransmitter-gated ion-channel transmembrane domain-containing protein n=1 Tax=Sesamum radiatum TaxID=300843 RepID=A0AAW2VME7_SESRA
MVNTTSFIASLSIIFLLMSGLPIKGRAFMWILMVMTWIAITAIALTYAVSVILLTPSAQEDSTRNVLGITVFIWICQITLLLLGHTLRLIVKMMKVVIRPFRVRRKASDSSLLRNNSMFKLFDDVSFDDSKLFLRQMYLFVCSCCESRLCIIHEYIVHCQSEFLLGLYCENKAEKLAAPIHQISGSWF